MSGCASGGPRVQAGANGEVTVVADWNDVDAAAIVAVQGCETTILSQDQTPTRQTFQLLTVSSQSGTLVARRSAAGGAGEGIPITLTCTVGQVVRDPERERCLLDGITRRLRDLAGVDFKPLR